MYSTPQKINEPKIEDCQSATRSSYTTRTHIKPWHIHSEIRCWRYSCAKRNTKRNNRGTQKKRKNQTDEQAITNDTHITKREKKNSKNLTISHRKFSNNVEKVIKYAYKNEIDLFMQIDGSIFRFIIIYIFWGFWCAHGFHTVSLYSRNGGFCDDIIVNEFFFTSFICFGFGMYWTLIEPLLQLPMRYLHTVKNINVKNPKTHKNS